MRILLLTVAGLSSRFSRSLGKPVLKCLYYKNCIEESLLYQMLRRHCFFEKIVIVGGYKFEELKEAVRKVFPELLDKIILVKNDQYDVYGSGYSFYKGISVINGLNYKEVVFAEGDLFFDEESFKKICLAENNIMTYGCLPIESDKSVVFYVDENDRPHYIYDTEHLLLKIDEPFKAIYNSGQVWKFADREVFEKTVLAMEEEKFKGTNLTPINAYFQAVNRKNIDYIGFKKWINCNTVMDFEESLGG